MSKRPKGTGFVRERGNSRQLVFKIGGKQYSRTVNTRTLREAQKLPSAFIAEVQSGAVAAAYAAKAKANEAPTFSLAVTEFIERELSRDKRNNTRQAYAKSLQRVAKLLGNEKVSKIGPHMIRDAMLTINRESTIGTVKLIHAVLGVFFRNLVDRGTVATMPVQPLKKLRLPPAGNETKKRGALTIDQVRDLIDACGDDAPLRLWIETMLATGMRPGEALALTWGSIDFERRSVNVAHSVKESEVRGQGRLGSTKTTSSVRDVPLGAVIAASLERTYFEREATYRSFGMSIEPDDCVFAADVIDARKVPKSLSAMQSRFKAARNRAGLKGATAHYLRHTALTAAIAGTATMPGISMADAARLAGHSNATQIARVYGHAVQANLTRGAGLADAMLAPRPAAPDNVLLLEARKGT